MSTRLRFEAGEAVPDAGATVIMESLFAHTRYAVTIHRVKRVQEHPSEPGVHLVDCIVTERALAN